MDLGPIDRPESAVDACEGALRRAILAGELAPRPPRPPARAPARRFDVNRVTVRSALGRLAAARLLSVRQGSGYVVRDFGRTGGPDLLPGLAELAGRRGDLRAVARDLLHVRRHLARAVLERVLESDDRRGLARIAEAVDRFEEQVEAGADADELARCDLEIVRAVTDATGSPVLRLCMNPLVSVLAELPALRDALYARPEENVAAWRALIEVLSARRSNALDAVLAAMEARDEETVARLRAGRRSRSRR